MRVHHELPSYFEAANGVPQGFPILFDQIVGDIVKKSSGDRLYVSIKQATGETLKLTFCRRRYLLVQMYEEFTILNGR